MTDQRTLNLDKLATDCEWWRDARDNEAAPPSTHRLDLTDATAALLTSAAHTKMNCGFGILDEQGRLRSDGSSVGTRTTARATYAFSLASLWDSRRYGELGRHGVESLRTLRAEDGLWAPESASPSAPRTAYDHAFVLLAAAAAAAAGLQNAENLLNDAAAAVLGTFWDEAEGRCIDEVDKTSHACTSYRGANGSMHMVEAFLATQHATGDKSWGERAGKILDHIILDIADRNEWRVPEHFNVSWQIDDSYNASIPYDRFKPPGRTPGHGLEWARLCLHRYSDTAETSLLKAAIGLFARAIEDGWQADRGWLYTTRPNGRPWVLLRPHWVLTEALATGWMLLQATGEEEYASWYGQFWNTAVADYIDPTNGTWRHELDVTGRPSALISGGQRTDVYHALQALLVPRCGVGSSVLQMVSAVKLHQEERR